MGFSLLLLPGSYFDMKVKWLTLTKASRKNLYSIFMSYIKHQ